MCVHMCTLSLNNDDGHEIACVYCVRPTLILRGMLPDAAIRRSKWLWWLAVH